MSSGESSTHRRPRLSTSNAVTDSKFVQFSPKDCSSGLKYAVAGGDGIFMSDNTSGSIHGASRSVTELFDHFDHLKLF